MRVALGVTADFASVTNDGKLNILGMFTEINPPRLPFALPTMYLVALLEAEEEDYGRERNISISFQDSGGRDLLPALQNPVNVPFPPRPGRPIGINQTVALTSVQLQQAGECIFTISVDGEDIGHVGVYVNQPQGA
jgi:hypothetical protein